MSIIECYGNNSQKLFLEILITTSVYIIHKTTSVFKFIAVIK